MLRLLEFHQYTFWRKTAEGFYGNRLSGAAKTEIGKDKSKAMQ